MAGHGFGGGSGVVGQFVVEGTISTTHPAQLQAQGPTAVDAGGLQFGFGQIPAQVAVEFPIAGIAGVAIAGRPHRQGGVTVPGEEGHRGRRTDRCIHAIAGPGQGMEQAMGIEHGVAQAGIGQFLV